MCWKHEIGQNSATKMKISQINCGFNVQFRRLHMSYRQRWPIFVMFFIHSIVFCEIFIQNVIHSIIMKFHSFLENIHFIIFGFHSIQKKYSCFKKGPYSIQNFIQFNENLCHSFKKIIHLFWKISYQTPLCVDAIAESGQFIQTGLHLPGQISP